MDSIAPNLVPQSATPKLSFCIATFNRAAFIGETLENLIAQATDDCEIVISDNASTDDTEQIVSEYTRRCGSLHYFRQSTNVGVDRNFNHAVELARGEYCWLMSDDDRLYPGAVAAILEALHRNQDLSLVIVNTEYRSFDMSKVVQYRALDFDSDRAYGSDEMDRLFQETFKLAVFIGCLVIKREIWLAREKERYFGSLWIHLGVIFQARLPARTLVVAKPYISYRFGNTHSLGTPFETSQIKLPSVVQSLAVSQAVKQGICRIKLGALVWLRAAGWYSVAEYERWIRPRSSSIRERLLPALVTMLPGVLLNAFYVFYYSLAAPQHGVSLERMRESRFHVRNWRVFKRKWSSRKLPLDVDS